MKHLFLPGILLSFLALPVHTSGPSDDLGTLPAAGAQPDPGRTQPGTVAVSPCETDANGGTAAANQCGSEGDIFIKSNGDVNVTPGTTGVVATGSRTDTVNVDDDCAMVIAGPASAVNINGFGCDVTVTNTHPYANMPVKVGAGASPVYVAPGETKNYKTVPAPGS